PNEIGSFDRLKGLSNDIINRLHAQLTEILKFTRVIHTHVSRRPEKEAKKKNAQQGGYQHGVNINRPESLRRTNLMRYKGILPMVKMVLDVLS
ncbi:MAG: hypothetical protein COB66_08865, partial [Coxiella sp. (in: Bacteria)]